MKFCLVFVISFSCFDRFLYFNGVLEKFGACRHDNASFSVSISMFLFTTPLSNYYIFLPFFFLAFSLLIELAPAISHIFLALSLSVFLSL